MARKTVQTFGGRGVDRRVVFVLSGLVSSVLWLALLAFCQSQAESAPVLRAPLQVDLADAAFRNFRRTVDYTLEARLDPVARRVTGRGRVVWTNRGHRPIRALWWHLYLNAFRNSRSTFMRESGGWAGDRRMVEGGWGFIEVNTMVARLISKGRPTGRALDILGKATFEHPDDDNADDRTVLRTPLPFEVAPGAAVEIELAFVGRLPRILARTGYHGDFFMVAQWFPKLGVLEDSYRGRSSADGSRAVDVYGEPRWNCHQYHALSEYFADYGAYRVAIVVPSDFVVGATGALVSKTDHEDGTTTHAYAADAVHDFAWTADRRFVEHVRTFVSERVVRPEEREEVAALVGVSVDEIRLRDVQVRLLIQPEHDMYADRYFRAAFAALKWFGLWFGAYPFAVLTVVDGPRGAEGAMGMEYPTLVTGGVSWPSPEDGGPPTGVTIHEVGHQYWYLLVGSNEFEEAWLDEGFTTYVAGKVFDREYGPRFRAPRLGGVPLGPWFRDLPSTALQGYRVKARLSPARDPIRRFAWRYENGPSYGASSYMRGALVLHALERKLTPAVFFKALRRYHQRWRFRHPTTDDFIVTVEEVAGRDLSEFFERTIERPGLLDYAVAGLKSTQVDGIRGFVGDPDAPRGALPLRVDPSDDRTSEAAPYRTTVSLERRGEVVRPVEVEILFEGGATERRRWDGRGRWARFVITRSERASAARLYPDEVDVFDLSEANDSRRRQPATLARDAWTERTLNGVMVAVDVLRWFL